MIRILAILLAALCVSHPASAKFEVVARATIPETFLKEFAKAKVHSSDDIFKVEIQELSPEERTAIAARLGEYRATKPTVSTYFPPFYPSRLRRHGISGTVDAFLVVSMDGSVREIYLHAYTDIEFAQAAALALKRWRFKRAAHDYVVQVPIPFRIRNEDRANLRADGSPVKSPPSNPGQVSGVPHP